MHAHSFFLATALVSGAIFAFVTPPFQVPDEPAHYYRSYAVSEGRLVAENLDGRTGGTLPESLVGLVELFDDVSGRPDRTVNPEAMPKARQLELKPAERIFLDFPTSAMYSPLPYLPQALGIGVGRVGRARPLVLLYLGRILNLLASTALIYWALRLLPCFRWLFAFLLLSPTATFLRSSMSADALTISFSFLLVAAVARSAFGAAKRSGWRAIGMISVASAALCLTKIPYAPLVLSSFNVPAHQMPSRRRAPALLVILAASAIAALVAMAAALSVEASLRPDIRVDSEIQVRDALERPVRFLGIVVEDYIRNSPRYVAEGIGRLGWLDTPLPIALIGSFLVVFILLLALDIDPAVAVSAWQRMSLCVIAASMLLLISASQYAAWTPHHADMIHGTQGRYFYPVVFVLPWILYSRRWGGIVNFKWVPVIASAFTLISLSVTLVVLFGRYWSQTTLP